MLKRSFITAAFLLTACGAPDAPIKADAKPADNFLTKLQADYPVALSKVADGVWVHTTNYNLPGQSPIPVNGLVVADDDDLILVDGAWGELLNGKACKFSPTLIRRGLPSIQATRLQTHPLPP